MSLRQSKMKKINRNLNKKNKHTQNPPQNNKISHPNKTKKWTIYPHQKNQKRERNQNSIKQHIKRSLQPLRSIIPPQQNKKKQNKQDLKNQIKPKKRKKTKTHHQKKTANPKKETKQPEPPNRKKIKNSCQNRNNHNQQHQEDKKKPHPIQY